VSKSNKPVVTATTDALVPAAKALGSSDGMIYTFGATTYAMGTVLRLMHSRTAEYAADAFAKSIGAGPDLASALEKLEASHSKVTKRDEKSLGLAANAFAASYIDNPRAGTRFVVVDDGRMAADASPEPGPYRAVARLIPLPYLSRDPFETKP
jgi:Zn-dependent protease with chaperone function